MIDAYGRVPSLCVYHVGIEHADIECVACTVFALCSEYDISSLDRT